jgi:hypothetical protein
MTLIKSISRENQCANGNPKSGYRKKQNKNSKIEKKRMMIVKIKKKSKPGATPVGLRPPSVAPGTFHRGFDLS